MSPAHTFCTWQLDVRWRPPLIQRNCPDFTAATITGSTEVSPAPQMKRGRAITVANSGELAASTAASARPPARRASERATAPTWSPRARSAWIRLRPKNPEPPVTNDRAMLPSADARPHGDVRIQLRCLEGPLLSREAGQVEDARLLRVAIFDRRDQLHILQDAGGED